MGPTVRKDDVVSGNNRDRLTDDDVERLRQLVLENAPPFQIAEALGRTVSRRQGKGSLAWHNPCGFAI
jgi:hypothetical protein